MRDDDDSSSPRRIEEESTHALGARLRELLVELSVPTASAWPSMLTSVISVCLPMKFASFSTSGQLLWRTRALANSKSIYRSTEYNSRPAALTGVLHPTPAVREGGRRHRRARLSDLGIAVAIAAASMSGGGGSGSGGAGCGLLDAARASAEAVWIPAIKMLASSGRSPSVGLCDMRVADERAGIPAPFARNAEVPAEVRVERRRVAFRARGPAICINPRSATRVAPNGEIGRLRCRASLCPFRLARRTGSPGPRLSRGSAPSPDQLDAHDFCEWQFQRRAAPAAKAIFALLRSAHGVSGARTDVNAHRLCV